MTESNPLEPAPMEMEPSVPKSYKKRARGAGWGPLGNVLKNPPDDIEVHVRAVRERLIAMRTASPHEREVALAALAPHIAALQSFSTASEIEQLESVQRRQRGTKEGVEKVTRRLHDIDSLLNKVRRVERSMGIEGQQAAGLKHRLELRIRGAQHSADPVSFLASSYQDAKDFLYSDVRFRPFFHEATQLMDVLRDKPEVVKNLLLPLFQKVLVDDLEHGGISPREGTKYLGYLLFAIDNNLLDRIPLSFENAHKSLEIVVENALSSMKSQFEGQPFVTAGTQLYGPALLRSTLLPNAIARVLVRPDGTLNLGIFDLVKKIYLPPRDSRDIVDRHIVSILKELEANKRLRYVLESIPVPTHPFSRGLVNTTLLRPYNNPVSESDVRITALTSLLTVWRQGNLGNCFIVARAVQQQEGATEWMLEDFRELLTTGGKIARYYDGKQTIFYGQEWAAMGVMARSIIASDVNILFSLDSIRNACRELGCESEQDFKRAYEIARQRKPLSEAVTMFDLFEVLRGVLGKSQSDLRRACWIAESPGQNLLLRSWENALGGVLFMPLVGKGTESSMYSGRYLKAIGMAFLYATGLPATPQTETLLSSLSVFPPSLRNLRACLVPQTASDPTKLSWALYVENNDTLVPFKDRVEFASFLHKAAKEWAEQAKAKLPQEVQQKIAATPPMKLIEVFEDELKKQHPDQKEGTMFGTLGYCMPGALGPVTVERTGSGLAQDSKPFLNLPLRGSIKALLQMMDAIRHTTTYHPSLLLPITADLAEGSHQFTLLLNHPSLMNGTNPSEGLVEQREEFAKKTRESVQNPSKLMGTLSHIVKEEAESIARKIKKADISTDMVYNEIVTCVASKIGSLQNPNIPAEMQLGDFLSVLWSSIDYVSTRYGCPFQPNDREKFLILSLTEIFPDYKDQFLHFADTNYEALIGHRSEAIHDCLWCNPLGGWIILQVPESGNVRGSIIVIAKPDEFFRGLTMELPIGASASLISNVREKEILLTDQQMTKRLQKIERQFATAWHALEEQSLQLDSSMRSSLQGQLRSGLDAEPSSGIRPLRLSQLQGSPIAWEEGLEQCLTLQRQYQEVLRKRATASPHFQSEYRYLQWFPRSEGLRLLMGTNEEVREALIRALS